MKEIRRQFRLGLLILLLLSGLLIQLLVQPWLGLNHRRNFIRLWSRALLRACGLRLIETGPSLAELAPGRMLVANHPSWLDIFAIDALAPAAFVAKAEIRRWPLVGRLVSQAGTLYIERGKRRAVPEAIQQMRERMRAGWPVAFFPEAGTHAGPELKPFHGNLLEAAIAESADVIPIGVRYRHADGRVGEAAHFLGDQRFTQSVWAILGEKDLQVELLVLPPMPTAGKTRGQLAGELRDAIGATLGQGRD
ncbi:MAG: lysophospholipid acyltransferase family protein [Lautropia sp.]|nr:lysophospholipid acyltransferase family protein [Lautropia sp.]